MWASKTLTMMNSFNGLVEHFALDNTYTELDTEYVKDFRQVEDLLFNVRFDKDQIQEDGSILNKGNQGNLLFTNDTELTLVNTFFQTPKAGLVGGTFEAESLFDGIACNDRHITTKLADGESYLRFNTPKLTEWSRANTIEFWFKIDDEEEYTKDRVLLSMTDVGGSFPYY